jgi:hypothetical protein
LEVHRPVGLGLTSNSSGMLREDGGRLSGLWRLFEN